MRYIEEIVGAARYGATYNNFKFVTSGTLFYDGYNINTTLAYSAQEDYSSISSISHGGYYYNKNTIQKINGVFGSVMSLYYDTTILVAHMDNCIALSYDNGLTFEQKELPANNVLFFRDEASFSRLYYSNGFVNELAIVLLLSNDVYYIPPPTLNRLSPAYSDITNAFDTSVVGYICNDNTWSPLPINYYNTYGYFNNIKYQPITVCNGYINSVSAFYGCIVHYSAESYNWSDGTYGIFISDIAYLQFFCSAIGEVKFRRLSDNDDIRANIINTFTDVPVNTTNAFCIIDFKFCYDPDIVNQPVSAYTQFEKYYCIASNGIHELSWNGSNFDSVLIYNDTIIDILYYNIEYVSKWVNTVISRDEVHKLHIYLKTGKYIVIDVSDKEIDTIVSSYDLGINLQQKFIRGINNKTAFIDQSNKIYILDGYGLLTYIVDIPYQIIGIRNNYILTNNGLFYYTSAYGLSNNLRTEQTRYVSNGYGGYSLTVYNKNGLIAYHNNIFYYNDYSANAMFSTTDFITYTRLLNSDNFAQTNQVRISSYEINSTIYFIQHLNGAINDYIYHINEEGSIKKGFNTYGNYGGIKSFLAYNDMILFDVLASTTFYKGYLLPFLGIYSSTTRYALKSYQYSSQLPYGSTAEICSIKLNTSIIQGQHIYIVISGNSNHGRYSIDVKDLDTNISTNVVQYGLLQLNTSLHITILHNDIPLSIDNCEITIKFKVYSADFNISSMSIVVHQIGMYEVIDNQHYKSCNETILIDDFISNAYTANGWLELVESNFSFTADRHRFFNFTFLYENLIDYSFYQTMNELYVLTCDRSIETNYVYGIFKLVNNTQEVVDELVSDWFSRISSVNLQKIANGYLVYGTYNDLDVLVNNATIDFRNKKLNNKSLANLECNGLIYNSKNTAYSSYSGSTYDTLAFSNNGIISAYFGSYDLLSSGTNTSYRLNYNISSEDILHAAIFTYSDSTSRYIAVGKNGFTSYSYHVYYNWINNYIATEDLIHVASYNINGTKIVIIGSSDKIYYSADYAVTFTQLTIVNNLKLTIMFKGIVYLFGTNTIAYSSNLLDWTLLGHNLEFEPNTAAINNSILYVGCNDGKILKSTDGLYWSFMSSNIKGNITSLINAVTGSVTRLEGTYYSNKLLTDVLSQNDAIKLSYEHTISAIYGDTFNVNLLAGQYYTDNYIYNITKKHNWADILHSPDFVLYKDAACTTVINNSIYISTSVSSIIINATTTEITIVFNDSINLAQIGYVYSTVSFGYSNYREITLRPITINETTKTVIVRLNITDYEPLKSLYENISLNITEYKWIGIPTNSLFFNFSSDKYNLEEISTSIYLKLTSNKLYDNLTIASYNINSIPTYRLLAAASSNSSVSNLHNFSPCRNIKPDLPTIPDKIMYTLGNDSIVFIYGLLAQVHGIILDIRANTFKYEIYIPSDIEPYRDYSNTTSILPNIYKSSDIKTITQQCSVNISDRNGEYYIIRTTNNAFAELSGISGYIIFNNRVYYPVQYNPNGSHLGGWYYINDNAIAILPFYNYTTSPNPHIDYTIPIEAFTGECRYVKIVDTFNYSSDALQPMYSYVSSDIEFNLDSAPSIWERVIELPQMLQGSVIKINVKRNCSNYRSKLVGDSVVTIHGVEYLS